MLKIALCDDNESIRIKFINMLNQILEKNNIEGEIVYDTSDPIKFYNYICKNHIDVILLDIDLKSLITGIDLAKSIREKNNTINIIFITAHIEYVLLSFKVKTFDYLIKPVSAEKLEECILRLIDFSDSDNINFVRIKSGSSTHFIKKSNIVYIEKSNSKTYIYALNEIIETNLSLNELEKILPDNFHRSHKSYIVNIGKVSRIDSTANEIIFNNSYKCSLGRKYRKNIINRLDNYDNDKHLTNTGGFI